MKSASFEMDKKMSLLPVNLYSGEFTKICCTIEIVMNDGSSKKIKTLYTTKSYIVKKIIAK